VVAVPAGQPAGMACRRMTTAVMSAAQGQALPMQYRPGLLDGFLAKTGLDLTLS
jgi:hypothetical protein